MDSASKLFQSVGKDLSNIGKSDIFVTKTERERDELREALLQKDARIQELELVVQQVDQLKETMVATEKELAAAHGRAVVAEKERIEVEANLETTSAALEEAKSRIATLEHQIEETEARARAASAVVAAPAVAAPPPPPENETPEEGVERMKKEMEAMRKELEDARRDARDAEYSARRKDDIVVALNADREEVYRDVTNLRETNIALSMEVEKLTQALAEAQSMEAQIKTGVKIVENRKREVAQLTTFTLAERAIKNDSDFKKRFPELADDVLVEYFMCSQGAHGTHPGYVYVARRHLCWQAYGIGSARIIVPLSRIVALDKVRVSKILEGFFFDVVCQDPDERVHLHAVAWSTIMRSILRVARAAGAAVEVRKRGILAPSLLGSSSPPPEPK